MRVVEAAGLGGEAVREFFYRAPFLLIESPLQSAQNGDILGARGFWKKIVFDPKRGFAEKTVALDDKPALFVQAQRAAGGLGLLRFLRETVQRYGRRIDHAPNKPPLIQRRKRVSRFREIS